MVVRVLGRRRFEDDLQILQRRAVESRSRHARSILLIGTVGIGQINDAVLREVRVKNDVEQPGLTARVHFRNAHDRLWLQLAVLDQPQAARPLRHQDSAVRQKRKRPRVVEPGRDLGHLISAVHDFGLGRRRWWRTNRIRCDVGQCAVRYRQRQGDTQERPTRAHPGFSVGGMDIQT